jgi:hypothetical protein
MQSGELSKVSMRINNWSVCGYRCPFPTELVFFSINANLHLKAWYTYDISTGLSSPVIWKASEYDFTSSNKNQL